MHEEDETEDPSNSVIVHWLEYDQYQIRTDNLAVYSFLKARGTIEILTPPITREEAKALIKFYPANKRIRNYS